MLKYASKLSLPASVSNQVNHHSEVLMDPNQSQNEIFDYHLKLLNIRWHQMRLLPIQEELREFTKIDIKVLFQAPHKHQIGAGGLIFLDLPMMPKAVDALAAIFAYQWGLLALNHLPEKYRKLIRNPIDNLSAQRAADKFAAIFLAHHNYDMSIVYNYLTTCNEFPRFFETPDSAPSRAKKMLQCFKKTKAMIEDLTQPSHSSKVIPFSYCHSFLIGVEKTIDEQYTSLPL